MLDRDLEQRFCQARRAAIALDFVHLNPEQCRAALCTEGPLLLLAGAGSGKTTVLIHRVANLIRYGRGSDSNEVPDWVTPEDVAFLEDYIYQPTPEKKLYQERLCALEPAAPWSIIAITFTNKAAGELKERLERILGPAALDVWASTFHSACVRILRRDIDKLGFDPSFTIYDDDDSIRVIKDIIKEQGLDDKMFPPRSVLGYISRAKDAMELSGTYMAKCQKDGDIRLIRIARVYQAYEKRLWDANALDFDDIILHTVRLLESSDEVRAYYQNKFRYVLIDEYQDTNNLQYRLAALLAGKWENICVVGDDDQSIYRFRGATIENILSFEKQFKGAQTIRLEQNYRSTKNILAASNAVIRHNRARKGKELWTEHGAGDKVQVYTAMNEHDEAQFILSRIMSGLNNGRKEKDFAILYRNNTNANVVYQTLVRNGISVYQRHPMTASMEIRDIMAYLYLVQNGDDNLRLKRIINVPPRGIGDKTVEMLETLSAQRGESMLTVLCEGVPVELSRAAGKLDAFRMLMEDLKMQVNILDLPAFYEYLLEKSGYIRALEEKQTPENQRRIDRLMEFKSVIQDYMLRARENGLEPSLTGFLEELALDEQLGDQNEEDSSAKPKEERVQMMTMHGAKGLEFPEVFLIAMEDGIFPGTRSIGEQEEMEEERRLCYVAMTRAKERLHICCAAQRMLYGKTTANRPSRFVGEIPPELLEQTGRRVPARSAWMDEEDYGYDWDQSRSSYGRTPIYGRSGYSENMHSSGPGYGTNRYSSAAGYSSPRPSASQPAGVRGGYTPKPVSSGGALPDFHKGDMVRHKAFGTGMVLSIQHMGGDALVEIAFDTVGTKKLMLKSAAKHMTKL